MYRFLNNLMLHLYRGDEMEFKDALRKARKEKNLSQKELANKTGLKEITIRKYESGAFLPKMKNFLAIKKVLGDSLEDTAQTDFLEDLIEFTDEHIRPFNLQRFAEHSPNGNIKDKLLHNFNAVNEEGQQKIVEYSNDIAENPKYKKGDD